jgi:hypothetical protein
MTEPAGIPAESLRVNALEIVLVRAVASGVVVSISRYTFGSGSPGSC